MQAERYAAVGIDCKFDSYGTNVRDQQPPPAHTSLTALDNHPACCPSLRSLSGVTAWPA